MTTPNRATLLDLVQTVSACVASDDEIVATVTYLVNSGKVLLCGNFAGAKINLSASTGASPTRRLCTRSARQEQRTRRIAQDVLSRAA
jgi:hypothetical protein